VVGGHKRLLGSKLEESTKARKFEVKKFRGGGVEVENDRDRLGWGEKISAKNLGRTR